MNIFIIINDKLRPKKKKKKEKLSVGKDLFYTRVSNNGYRLELDRDYYYTIAVIFL